MVEVVVETGVENETKVKGEMEVEVVMIDHTHAITHSVEYSTYKNMT